MNRPDARTCPHATQAPDIGLGRFGRWGRVLPLLLALAMLGNVVDCVRVDARTAISAPVTRQRPRRPRGRRLPG